MRHFTELSTRNFGIDTGFYPLGSCTMKHNPRVNERVVMLPGFKDLHPHQEEDGAQGALELMWRLQEILEEVAGLDACSLQPAAGSQGELTGLMLMRAYFEDIGEGEQRDTIITADTAHGTNPASVTMAGYKLEKVGDRRAREPRPRRSAREGERAHRRADADEPVHARALRREHRGGREDLPRRRLAPLLRRREPERRLRDLAAGRHGLRHRPHQPAQDVLAAARGRRARRRADRRPREARAVPARARDRQGRRRVPARPRPAEVDRQGARLHRPVRRLRPLLRLHPRVRAGAAGDVGGGRAERELPAREAPRRVRPALRPARACTSSCSARGR